MRTQLYRRNCLLVSIALISIGLLYYLVFRESTPFLLFAIGVREIGSQTAGASSFDPSAGAFPSLVHMLALTLLAVAIFGQRRAWVVGASLTALVMTWTGEFHLGVFDPNDVIAAGVGWLLPILGYYRMRSSKTSKMRVRNWLGLVFIAGVTVSGIMGTSPPCENTSRGCNSSNNATPVYMSYEELRSAVAVEPARELDTIGRVYLYRNFILLNESNQGIHVLDNSDPTAPVNRAFISIPGNTELAIRNNYLHADSYVDLVTIDLNSALTVQEVDREQDVFPFDAYQNIPEGINFSSSDIDPTLGVIVDYKGGSDR